MSKHYTAYQYDPAYQPNALGNWEVPHYYCNKPRTRTGRTKIIANNVGNLLPGVPRPNTTPWGNYIGTWHLPRRIDRKLASILNGSAELEAQKEKCRRHLMAQRRRSENLGIKPVEGAKLQTGNEPQKQEEEKHTPTETVAAVDGDDKKEAKMEIRICPIHGPF